MAILECSVMAGILTSNERRRNRAATVHQHETEPEHGLPTFPNMSFHSTLNSERPPMKPTPVKATPIKLTPPRRTPVKPTRS